MRILKGIRHPRRGEHVLAVDPELSPEVIADWRRRLNFFTGRALSHIALEIEQTGHETRLSLRGRAISHGVVEGLAIGLERGPAGAFIHLNPGAGVAPTGDDVTVPQPLRVPADAPQVYIPPETGLGSGHTRRSLAELIAAGDADPLPRACILVLEPMTIPLSEQAASTDPCVIDEQDEAFADWQLVDGAALTYYIWPIDRIPLPPFDAAQWRNHLAQAIFEVERAADPAAILPWEQIGLPVGLVGFGAGWEALFADRYSVVRAGGRPRRRTPLIQAVGSPFLWQARMQHFSEFVADLTLEGQTAAQIAAQVRYLPPASLLPLGAVEPRVLAADGATSARNHFFPPGYIVEAIPVVLEQLDVVLEASASLDPFDLTVPDRVRVAVPVPQIWYEPRLLQVEAIADEFQETLDEFALRRNRWLGRREQVRAIASALVMAMTGEPIIYPDPDPNAVGEEKVLVGDDLIDPDDPALAEVEEEYGTALLNGTRVVTALQELRAYLATRSPLRRAPAQAVLAVRLRDLETRSVPGLSASLPENAETTTLTYDRVMSQMTRDAVERLLAAQPNVSRDMATVAAAELHRESQRNELAQLDALGLNDFIRFLQDRVDESDDRIDLGFVKAQTNIYRVRQLLLGNTAASRLATSPALAEIAKGDTAAATQEDIRRFLDTVIQSGELARIQGVEPAGGASAPEGERAAGTAGVAGRVLRSQPSMPPAGPTGGAQRNLFVSRELMGLSRLRSTSGASIGTSLRAGVTATAGSTLATGSGGLLAGGALREPGLSFALGDRRLRLDVDAASSGALFDVAPSVPIREAIVDQAHIVGKAYSFRTLTVAERLRAPEANEAKEATVSAKYEAAVGFQQLLEAGINLDDLTVPGVAVYDDNGPIFDPVDPKDESLGRVLRREPRTLAELAANDFVDLLRDPDPADASEADFFSLSVLQTEHTVAMLRLVEGRIRAYKEAIARCRQTLAAIGGLAARVDQRLKAIGDELAEGRHDVAVAMALLDEEHARITAINDRRDRIITEHVDFLAYYRPRLGDNRNDAPVRVVDSGLATAPVPACLSQRVYVVPELREMVSLLRDVPLRWLNDVRPLLDRLDRIELMVDVIVAARNRALTAVQLPLVQHASTIAEPRTLFAQSLNTVYTAQQSVLAQYWASTARLDLSIQGLFGSWQSARATAEEHVTLSDLIGAGHGRSDVVDQATTALNRVMHVAACLYNEFAAVLPIIRLDWAQRLSQFDEEVSLRNLASLPRWGEIERLERRDMQAMVDWLFQRVDAGQPDAVAYVNSLVRTCILLASHAPVDELIAASVEEAATAREGSRVRIKIDPARVRVGMGALIYQGNSVVAQALVDDLAGSVASVRIVKTMQPTVEFEANARVQLAEPEALFINPQTSEAIAGLAGGSSHRSPRQ